MADFKSDNAGMAENFIHGYLDVRTTGSSSKHKLDTKDDLWFVTDKYFTRCAAEAALEKLITERRVLVDGIYLCTRILEIE